MFYLITLSNSQIYFFTDYSSFKVCDVFGKQTKVEEFSIQKRGGKGVIAIQTSERNGKVIGANQVNENDEVMFISSSGNLIRTKINSISVIGRNTQGVKLIRLSDDDKLLGMERIINDSDDEE